MQIQVFKGHITMSNPQPKVAVLSHSFTLIFEGPEGAIEISGGYKFLGEMKELLSKVQISDTVARLGDLNERLGVEEEQGQVRDPGSPPDDSDHQNG